MWLGVSRKTLSALLNGHFGISPDMGIRLSIAFNGSAKSWLNQQAQFNLWQARQKAGDFIAEFCKIVLTILQNYAE